MKPNVWPFVPPAHRKNLGESPFRVRGSVYAGYVERINKQVPGGLSTICAEIGKKDIEVFLRNTIFLATSTYDMEPMMHIMHALAKLNHTPLDKFIRDGSRGAGEQDVFGKYRAQLRSTSTEEMATRLPRIFGRYFDPCRVETVNVQAQATEMRYSGLPASALGFYLWSSEGFVCGALEAVGARDVRFAWDSPVPDGELEGVPLQTITSRVSWTNSVM
jgi:hypothetical protein